MTTHDRKTTSPGTSLLLLGLCAAGFLCAEPATAQKKRVKDAILRKDGKQLRNIEVLAMKVDKVTYKQRGKENVISSSQVESVKWDEALPDRRQGREGPRGDPAGGPVPCGARLPHGSRRQQDQGRRRRQGG
ncbi:MAG: hypothetical protein ACYTGW_09965 [Planctomycetota bacterium]|jgi:hypothetical protein